MKQLVAQLPPAASSCPASMPGIIARETPTPCWRQNTGSFSKNIKNPRNITFIAMKYLVAPPSPAAGSPTIKVPGIITPKTHMTTSQNTKTPEITLLSPMNTPQKTSAKQPVVNGFPGKTRALACFRPRHRALLSGTTHIVAILGWDMIQLISSNRAGSPGNVFGARWMQGGTGLPGQATVMRQRFPWPNANGRAPAMGS